MNRAQARNLGKDYLARRSRFINKNIGIILASAAEWMRLPLAYVELKYIDSDDKGKMIEDLKYIVEGIKKGTHEMKNGDFVKVED
jgi:hypothetical protein